MKQLVIPRYGAPEVLEVREAPDPSVVPGTVRIRVRAAGINFSDLLARQGLYPDAPKPPCTVGYEVAGVVDAVGAGVTAPRAGDRVVATTRFGGQSELVVVPVTAVFPLPAGWTFEQGAAFPVVYLTAHHLLVRVAAARRGETVLVHAAAGGVGLAVAELGRLFGFRVLGLASSGKHAILREYGVEPLDSRDPGWFDAVRRVFRFPRFGPLALMNDNKSVAGVNLGHLWNDQALLLPQVEALLGYAREGRLTPRWTEPSPSLKPPRPTATSTRGATSERWCWRSS